MEYYYYYYYAINDFSLPEIGWVCISLFYAKCTIQIVSDEPKMDVASQNVTWELYGEFQFSCIPKWWIAFLSQQKPIRQQPNNVKYTGFTIISRQTNVVYATTYIYICILFQARVAHITSLYEVTY